MISKYIVDVWPNSSYELNDDDLDGRHSQNWIALAYVGYKTPFRKWYVRLTPEGLEMANKESNDLELAREVCKAIDTKYGKGIKDESYWPLNYRSMSKRELESFCVDDITDGVAYCEFLNLKTYAAQKVSE